MLRQALSPRYASPSSNPTFFIPCLPSQNPDEDLTVIPEKKDPDAEDSPEMVERKFMLEATEDFTAVLSHLATQAALGTKVRNKYKVSVDFGMECFKDWPHMVLFPYLSMSDRCKRVRFCVLVLDISLTFR